MSSGNGDRSSEHTMAVLGVFEDAEPKTAETVAVATGLDVETVRSTLDELVDRGVLCQKTVRGHDAPERLSADELDELAVELWYLPANRLAGGEVVVTIDDEAAVEAALDELSLPGASELMKEWRRNAVRAAYEYLNDRETATRSDFLEDVYPPHAAGYSTADDWWAFIAPRLAELPNIECGDEPDFERVDKSGDDAATDHGDEWRFAR